MLLSRPCLVVFIAYMIGMCRVALELGAKDVKQASAAVGSSQM